MNHLFIKKPVVVEAFQITKETRQDNSNWPNWLNEAWNRKQGTEGSVWPYDFPASTGSEELMITTLEGDMKVCFDDFIIQGVKGELYPCKPEIFHATYDKYDKTVAEPSPELPEEKPSHPDTEQVIDAIRQIRIGLDAVAQTTRKLGAASAELLDGVHWLQKAEDSAFLAKAWLGKILGKLEAEYPYPNDGTRTSTADIEPTAERATVYDFENDVNEVAVLDELRTDVSNLLTIYGGKRKLLHEVFFTSMPTMEQSQGFEEAETNFYQHAAETRFAFGFCLGAIYDKLPQTPAPTEPVPSNQPVMVEGEVPTTDEPTKEG